MVNSSIIYPSNSLSQYIKYYWILKTNETESRNIQTIPSGCIHLVFHRGSNLLFASKQSQPKSFIRGQLSNSGRLVSSGKIDMIAVVFHPLGISPFISFPMCELYNQYVDIEDIEDLELKELRYCITNEKDDLVSIQQIESFLLRRMYTMEYNYKRIAGSIQTIINNPTIDVAFLADNACLGYRHFKRVFARYIGMNPKEYIRVIRFQKVLYTLQNMPTIDITQLAYTCGFFDHSHLDNDFKSLTGYSPTEYLSSRVPYSTFFSNNCKLNLINI